MNDQNLSYLKIGDNGYTVIKLQNSLNKKGYDVPVNGKFGPETFRAVADFQRSVSLSPDGIVGRQTWSALDGITPIIYQNPVNVQSLDVIEENFDANNFEYYKEIQKKDKIILQNSNTMPHPSFWAASLESIRNEKKIRFIGTSFAIGGKISDYIYQQGWIKSNFDVNGKIYKFFNDEYWSNIIINSTLNNNTLVNSTSIGITLCSWGSLFITKTGNLVNKLGYPVSDSEVFDLGYNYKGTRFFHMYSDEQIESLRKILIWLISKYNMKISKGIYGQQNWYEVNRDALSNKSGIWNLNNFIENSDLTPQPKLVQILNSL